MAKDDYVQWEQLSNMFNLTCFPLLDKYFFLSIGRTNFILEQNKTTTISCKMLYFHSTSFDFYHMKFDFYKYTSKMDHIYDACTNCSLNPLITELS